MAFDLSAASNILKVRYIGTIREQLNNSTVLMSKIGRSDQMVSGKSFTVPLHTGRNESAASARADGGTLPTAGTQGYSTTIVPNRYLYSSIKVTGPTIAAARDNVGAFVQALESEIDGVQRDTKRRFNRQLHGDGSGWLAFWTAADDVSGTNVDDGQGNAFVHLDATALTCALIDASDHTTSLDADMRITLGAKNGDTSYAVTWTGSISGSADGDYLVLFGSRDSSGLPLEMMGIQGIVDDADPPTTGGLQSLAVASNAFWKAQVFGNSGTNRALAFEDMQEVLDAVESQSDYMASDVIFLLSNYPMRRAYYKLAVAERRHVNTMSLDGGFKALDFNGVPFVVDNQCRRNVIYFINPDTMKIFRTSDFDWMDKDGSYLSRASGVDAYEAVLFHYGNLACLSRNGNGLLEDLIEA